MESLKKWAEKIMDWCDPPEDPQSMSEAKIISRITIVVILALVVAFPVVFCGCILLAYLGSWFFIPFVVIGIPYWLYWTIK